MRAHAVTLSPPHQGPARSAHHGGRSRRIMALLIALALVFVVARTLDPNRPWMKRHVQALVMSRTGLDVDYRSIRVHPLSGIEVDNFVVHTAAEFRAIAPDMLRASLLDVQWSASSLFGGGPRLERIALSDVTVAVVADEHGRTSLDSIFVTRVPLSRRPGQLLASTPFASRIDATRANVEILRTQGSRVVERDSIRGLGAAVRAEPSGQGWRVEASAGTIAEPLDVHVTQEWDDGQPARETQVGISLATSLTASMLDVSVNLSFPDVGRWHADASASFDPAASRTRVAIERVASASGSLMLDASIELPDDGTPFVRRAQGDVDVAPLLGGIPASLVPVTAQGGVLHVEVESATLEPVPRLLEGGFIHVESELTNARVRTSEGTVEAERSRGEVDVRPEAGPGVAVKGWQELDAATGRFGRVRVEVRDVAVDFDGERAADGALSGRLEARSRGAQVVDGGRRLLAGAHARMKLELRDLFPDARLLQASRGTVRASVEVDGNSASLQATAHAGAIDYSLHALAPSLKAVRPFLPTALADAGNWDAMALELRSNGRFERIASREPRLRQDTSLTIDGLAFRGLSARSLSLNLHSDGSASRHEANAGLRASGLTIDGTPASDDVLALSESWNRDARSLHLTAGTAGRANAQVEVSAAFDPDERVVIYDAGGQLSGLAKLAPIVARVRSLDGLDLSRLELVVAARGKLLGVISGVGSDGALELTPDPWRTGDIEGVADVRVANLRWTRPDVALDVPSAVWHGDMHTDGEERVLGMHADLASLRLGLGRHQIDISGISDDTTATLSGDLLNPKVDLVQRLAVRGFAQDFVPDYPSADATMDLSLRREPEGLVRVSALHLRAGAGTTIDLRGGLDLGARGNRKLSMVAEVVQDLQPLSFFPERFSGSGQVKVAANVESPDLTFFRTRLDVTVSGVQLRVPILGIDAQSVDAQVPVRMDFDALDDGVRIRRDGHNRYAMLRFADQHPFLGRSGFVTIGRLTTPQLQIVQFVGNLAVQQNVVSLGQFEMGVRGGRLAGDCSFDWSGPSSSLVAHLRANGVQSTYGEPLDGSMAVVISASDRSIEGRAEILRMGKRHLLDLLDVEDPLRVDPAMNRIRSALAFGYPSRVHVAFGNGFARARVELGGLARFMSIDELRGIPTGPLVDWLVKTVLGGRVTS
ncbi:MAG TPA: hypothetical protein VF765_00515 [Polyangiaceae bacterium]